MRIFDVYEHPTFELNDGDKAAAQTALLRIGLLVLSALAAAGYWKYYMPSKPLKDTEPFNV
ncbi:hypothetical protein EWM64_g537 [Hericium alpestre]|uniref:Uncharacterized protein n=1 Tax=Hericium alpestre TaxID=135208 RepID=A0A4Z0AAV2_9AGAM|nr:hypothetical protein EWM64_g537 [Hericium alpestre]